MADSAHTPEYKKNNKGKITGNLLQAQRDFFGAHTYEKVDKPRCQFFHTNFAGPGGTTASTTYNVKLKIIKLINK